MAITAPSYWVIKTGGSNSNGAVFDPTLGGVDYSQTTSPFFSYTDMVLVTTTTISSVARPFTANDVGNVICQTTGTGWNGGGQRLQILSVSAGIATIDKVAGTAASINGAGNLGGAGADLRTIIAGSAPNGPSTGNIVYQQAGTYNYSALMGTIFGVGNITIEAYSLVIGDGAGVAINNKTIASTGNFIGFTSTGTINWKSIQFFDTSATKGTCFTGLSTSSSGWSFTDVIIDGFSAGYQTATTARGANSLVWYRTIVRNCTNIGVDDVVGCQLVIMVDSQFYNCTNACYQMTASNSANILIANYCLFGKSQLGFSDNGTVRAIQWYFQNCTFVDCITAGLKSTETTSAPAFVNQGNIYYNCGVGASFAFAGGIFPVINDYNAWGANTTNAVGLPAGPHDITLTADPFNNRTTFDYTLNNVAGGGALCRNAIIATGQDVGAFQHTGGGTSLNAPNISPFWGQS